MMRWLGYLWTVVVNCFYLFIVVYVLDKLTHRPEVIVFAVLGLIYVTIRTIAIGTVIFHSEAYVQIHRQLFYIRKLLNDPSHDAVFGDFQEAGKVPNSALR